ncbi:MAG: gamma-glutamylcyclotransferase [Gammaproteobacteria bacterium]|nr:gamma-glutamylcyclotransferase [Gammaproteobacteria bacterium]
MRCFFFGSLMDRDVAELVLDRHIEPRLQQPGILHGYKRLLVAEESYPALAPRAGGKVTGVVVDEISDADLARMQFFESAEFAPVAREIELIGGEYVSAQTFIAREVLQYTDQPWDFGHWLRDDKTDYLALVRDWMAAYGKRETHQLEAAWSSARREQLACQQPGGSSTNNEPVEGNHE